MQFDVFPSFQHRYELQENLRNAKYHLIGCFQTVKSFHIALSASKASQPRC